MVRMEGPSIFKSKAFPVTGREGPWGCGTSRLSHFLAGRLTDGGQVVSLYTPGRFLVLIYARGGVDSKATVRLKVLGQLKNPTTIIGNRTRDLPDCSIMPQPATQPRVPPSACSFCNSFLS
jgi:hypothetical protein